MNMAALYNKTFLCWILVVLIHAFGVIEAGRVGSRKSGRDFGPFVLERLSQTYIPARYSRGNAEFCLGQGAAEQLAYDAEEKMLYVVGNKVIHVLDVEFPEAPIFIGHMDLSNDLTDVATCGGYVAVSESARHVTEPGHVHIFKAYRNRKGKDMKRLFKIVVGALPDMLIFTPKCSKLLVANEGEAGKDRNGNFVDPEGSISIIDMDTLIIEGDQKAAVKVADFRKFNEDWEELTEAGVRWVWRGQTGGPKTAMSQDLEPEYISVSKDGKTAFVALQENNAIAVVDLDEGEVQSIVPLGLKDFEQYEASLDASNRDDGVNLRNWPIFGLYQPDAIVSFNHKGEEYIVTANEGAPKRLDGRHGVGWWKDGKSGGHLVHEMSANTPPDLMQALKDPARLAHTQFSSLDGWAEKPENGKRVRDRLVVFGSRSFTIFRAGDMEPVYDSSDDLERLQGEAFPWAFNSDEPDQFCPKSRGETDINADTRNTFKWMERGLWTGRSKPKREPLMDPRELKENVRRAKTQLNLNSKKDKHRQDESDGLSAALAMSPLDMIDHSSPHSGIAPEALAIGKVGKTRLLFVALEKGGSVFVYDISDPSEPVWQSAVYPGKYEKSFAELYNAKEITDIDPEGMEFISAKDSPIDEPLLVVSGSLSGTVSIYRVRKSGGPRRAKIFLQSPQYANKPKAQILKTTDPTTTVAINANLG